MSALGSLKPSSLRDQAAQAIRNGIITGEIQPGELYSVPMLSNQLGVSATPVREAMLDLASEGLVVPMRNRGFRVVSLTVEDLDEILEVRLMLEVPGTGRVAESRRDDDLPRFRDLAEQMPAAVRAEDLQAYLHLDREFHLGLLGLLGNDRLVSIVGMLRNQIRLFEIGNLASTGELLESALEHGEILTAIERRERERTEELVRHHLVHARRGAFTAAQASAGGES
jgi:DNA-binding GntR family transcriptional regulator